MPTFEEILGNIQDEEIRAQVKSAYDADLNLANSNTEDIVSARVDTEVKGLKNKNEQLLKEKKKYQETLDQFKAYGTPEEIREYLETLKESKNSDLLKSGKVEEFIQKRVSEETSVYETKMAELNDQLSVFSENSQKYNSMYKRERIVNALSQAAKNAGVFAKAVDDVVSRGLTTFSLADDEYTIESRDSNGELQKSKDGKVLNMERWLIDLKEDYPHYWLSSKSGEFSGPGKSGESDLEKRIMEAAEGGNYDLYIALQDKLRERKTKGK